jgi:hypothetical protein
MQRTTITTGAPTFRFQRILMRSLGLEPASRKWSYLNRKGILKLPPSVLSSRDATTTIPHNRSWETTQTNCSYLSKILLLSCRCIADCSGPNCSKTIIITMGCFTSSRCNTDCSEPNCSKIIALAGFLFLGVRNSVRDWSRQGRIRTSGGLVEREVQV